MKMITKGVGFGVVRTTHWNGWSLTIMTPADYDGRAQPAASVELFGEDVIRQLRDALSEALQEKTA